MADLFALEDEAIGLVKISASSISHGRSPVFLQYRLSRTKRGRCGSPEYHPRKAFQFPRQCSIAC
jgi:hypothetical protein